MLFPSRLGHNILIEVECVNRRRFYSLHHLEPRLGHAWGFLRHGFWQECVLDKTNVFFVIVIMACSICAKLMYDP